MKQIFKIAALASLVLLVGCKHKKSSSPPPPTPTAPNGNASITGTFNGKAITITTSNSMAGTVTGITYNGKQFINSSDHGRELQTAISFDNLGECLNPTEAGGSYDGSSSTSVLKSISTTGNILNTTTQMAYWLSPGQAYGSNQGHANGCNEAKQYYSAQNTSRLSTTTVTKTVGIGYAGVANAIEYDVTLHIAENHTQGAIETATAYMPSEFSSFYSYDPQKDLLTSVAGHANGDFDTLPVVFSTADQQSAMGLYAIPTSTYYQRYGRWSRGVVNFNSFVVVQPMPAGDYSFRHFLVIGSLREVQNGMRSLYLAFNPTASSSAHSAVSTAAPAPAAPTYSGATSSGSTSAFSAAAIHAGLGRIK